MGSPLRAFREAVAAARTLRTAFARDLPAAAPGRAESAAAAAFRAQCRAGTWTGQSSGQAPGHVHANMVIVPGDRAFDFLLFALRNPRPCPLLAVTSPGDPCAAGVAPGSDLRTDLPRYHVYRHGELAASPHDVHDAYAEMEDPVGFLLGCSFTWEAELAAAGLEPRHLARGTNVPMYETDIRNNPSGPFGGNLVVSMRPFADEAACRRADAITARYPGAHGGPIHWGAPEDIGIDGGRLRAGAVPDWGDAVDVHDGEVPCFWACGVTPQSALVEARLPLAISHAPGHMFVCDLIDEDLLHNPAVRYETTG